MPAPAPAPPASPAASVAPLRCEDVPGHADFRPLAALAGIDFDLRYAGVDNFAGRVLYRGIDCAWLRREAAEGLETAAAWLARERPGWRIVVLDALRPQRVQEAIWAEVAETPMAEYFADPARGSIHSWGMAVDVTLVDAAGTEADMGSGFDEMDLLSHPALEAEHLALGALRAEHLVQRGWLRAAMVRGGFSPITTEWWHFDHGERAFVRRHLPRVE